MKRFSRFFLLMLCAGLCLLTSCSLVTVDRTKDYFSSHARYTVDNEPKFYKYDGKTYVLVHRKDFSRRSSDWVTWIMTKEKYAYHEQELPSGAHETYLFELPKAHDVSLIARLYDEPIKYPMNREELYRHIFANTKEASFIPASKIPLDKAKVVKSSKILKKEEKPTCGYPTMSEYSHRSLVGKCMWPIEKAQLIAVDTPGSILLTTLALPAAPFAMVGQQTLSSKDEMMENFSEIKGKVQVVTKVGDQAAEIKGKAVEVENNAAAIKGKAANMENKASEVKGKVKAKAKAVKKKTSKAFIDLYGSLMKDWKNKALMKDTDVFVRARLAKEETPAVKKSLIALGRDLAALPDERKNIEFYAAFEAAAIQ